MVPGSGLWAPPRISESMVAVYGDGRFWLASCRGALTLLLGPRSRGHSPCALPRVSAYWLDSGCFPLPLSLLQARPQLHLASAGCIWLQPHHTGTFRAQGGGPFTRKAGAIPGQIASFSQPICPARLRMCTCRSKHATHVCVRVRVRVHACVQMQVHACSLRYTLPGKRRHTQTRSCPQAHAPGGMHPITWLRPRG